MAAPKLIQLIRKLFLAPSPLPTPVYFAPVFSLFFPPSLGYLRSRFLSEKQRRACFSDRIERESLQGEAIGIVLRSPLGPLTAIFCNNNNRTRRHAPEYRGEVVNNSGDRATPAHLAAAVSFLDEVISIRGVAEGRLTAVEGNKSAGEREY